MAGKFTRRDALIGGSSALLLQGGCSTGASVADASTSDLFQHGVASGDPETHSVVIWTRVSGVSGSVGVDWQVATDPTFTNVVSDGRTPTNASRDYTVKVAADKLQPGVQYFYRFIVDWHESPVGMTKTLPMGSVDRLVLAVASCSNYPFGYFNAYEAIASDPEIDCVVHLGDYIYEYDIDGYGADAGRRLNRQHQPAHETLTLADYRVRHAQYKSDPGSIAMHRRHPLIAIWDDHESTNNPWTGGAQNHQPDEGSWEQRRAESLQAYFEWMPVRDPGPNKTRAEYWRHFKWGDLASLITLENRHTGRSRQLTMSIILTIYTPGTMQLILSTTLSGHQTVQCCHLLWNRFLRRHLASLWMRGGHGESLVIKPSWLAAGHRKSIPLNSSGSKRR